MISRVKGLTNKKKYKFRVLAENLAGPGKPSKETEPILVKDPIGIINILWMLILTTTKKCLFVCFFPII